MPNQALIKYLLAKHYAQGGAVDSGDPVPRPQPIAKPAPQPQGRVTGTLGTLAGGPGQSQGTMTYTDAGQGGAPDVTNPYSTFKAQAPQSNLQFQQAQLDKSKYGNSVNQGMQQAGDVYGRQSALAQSLMAQANGGGPNLAAQQERQATDRNISQAYALAQSQANNPGAQRQIAQQAGQMNQQAAADSATQRMQQQLAAQEQLAGVLGTQGQQSLGLLGTAGGLQGQQNQLNLQNLTDQEKLQLQQNQGNQQAYEAAQALNQNTALSNSAVSKAIVGGTLNAAGGLAANAGQMFGGGSQGGGYTDTPDMTPATPMSYADGGEISLPPVHIYNPQIASVPVIGSPSSSSNPLTRPDSPADSVMKAMPFGGLLDLLGKGLGAGGQWASNGVNSALGLKPMPHYQGGEINYQRGGKIPGKAEVEGNSGKNDTVPAMLSPGEIVLPRTVAQADDAPDKAKAFVQAIKRQKNKAPAAPKSYGELLAHVREIRAQLAQLEAKAKGGR